MQMEMAMITERLCYVHPLHRQVIHQLLSEVIAMTMTKQFIHPFNIMLMLTMTVMARQLLLCYVHQLPRQVIQLIIPIAMITARQFIPEQQKSVAMELMTTATVRLMRDARQPIAYWQSASAPPVPQLSVSRIVFS